MFKKAFRIDLLSQSEYFKYLKEPWRLYNEYNREIVRTDVEQALIIDEIQKAPAPLDEVQRLIKEDGQTMILCGTSVRNLKRNQANLLGGRARSALSSFDCFSGLCCRFRFYQSR